MQSEHCRPPAESRRPAESSWPRRRCLFIIEQMGNVAETNIWTMVVVSEEIQPLYYGTLIGCHRYSWP